MKKTFHLLGMMGKYYLFGFLLQLIFMNWILAAPSNAQASLDIKEVKVSLNIEEASLNEVFEAIKRETIFYFVYDQELVKQAKTVDMKVQGESLEAVLLFLASTHGISFRQVNERISVKETRKNTQDKAVVVEVTVSGTVVDSNGDPIPGVTVSVPGTSIGTATDLEGGYTLSAPEGSTLMFSFIGFVSQSVVLADQSVIDITLVEDMAALDEVVVVGFGTQRKRDLTGSVASVDAEDLEARPNVSIIQSLQGAIAGMNVGQVNTAGEEPSLSIRGRISISGSQNPLIVVDGVIFRGSLIDINPSDVSSIDVLKDASSTAVYGSQAANGVIIITTKTGAISEKFNVNYSTYYSFLEPTKKFLPESPSEHIERISAAYFLDSRTEASGYLEPNPDFDVTSTFRTSDHERAYQAGLVTDWYNLTTNNKLRSKNHNFSISKRNKEGGYYLSAGYTDQDGYMVNEDYERLNFRINIDNNLTDWLEVGVQTFITSSDYSGYDISPSSRYLFSLYAPEYQEDGVTLLQNPRGVGTGVYNPLLVKQSEDLDQRLNLFGNVNANITFPFLEGLSLKVNYNINSIRNSRYFYRHYVNDFQGQGQKYEGIGNNWANDNILTFNRIFNNKHRINATIAYGREKRMFNSTTANAFYFISDELGYNRLQAGSADLQSVTSNAWQETSLYNLNRLFYGYDDKYLFTLTVRRDGFSGFGKDYKYGTFPSASMAWVLSEENFFKDKFNEINNLKLRGSYGANGNRTIGRYSTLSRVAGGFNYINGSKIPVYTQGNATLANPDLKWETTIGVNFGLDFSLFDSRLSGSIDYYNTNTEDLLYDVDIPGITRFESISDNLGKLHNQGMEVTLSTLNISKENFQWSTDINFSRNRNKLKELLGFDVNGDGIEDDLISEELFINESLGAIYDYETNGDLWQIGDEIPNSADIGSYIITDHDGNGVIDPNDRIILGNSLPSFRISLNNRLSYKNWSLSVFINSIQGNSNYYLGRDALVGGGFNGLNDMLWDNTSLPPNLDFWLPENPDARYQRLGVRLSSGINSSRYLDRSFIRLQDVNLSYTLNKQTLAKLFNIQSVRLFMNGKNLITWTKWPGWDPETGQGITINGRPVMRQYIFGIDVKF